MGKLRQKLRGGKTGKRGRNDAEEFDGLDYEDEQYAEEYDEYDQDQAYDEEEYEYEIDDDEYEDAEGYEDDEYEDDYASEEEYGEDDEEEEYEDDGEDEEAYEIDEEDAYDEYEDAEEYEEDAYEEDGEYEDGEYGDAEEGNYETDDEFEEEEYPEDDYDDGEEYEYDGDEEIYEEEYDDVEDDEEYEYDEYDEYEDGTEDEEEYEYDEYDDEIEEDEAYEEEYEYDEEEYDEDEEDGEIYEEEERGIKKVAAKLLEMSLTDHVMLFTGAAVLLLAVFTGFFFMKAKSEQQLIETFAEIGEGVEEIGVIGESGLVAVADAQAAKYFAATMGQETEQEEEWGESQGQENGGGGAVQGETEVALHLTSIQKDLKIKFINKKSGKLIPSVAFEVDIIKPSGGTYTMKDEDKDGIIYQTGIEPGKYQVKITAPASDSKYSISSETVTVTVKDTIEYKKVEIADEVKTEAQVNVAVEDTKVNETVVESENKDTVEWVESSKTLIEGTGSTEESYEKVDRSSIANPEQQARAGFRLLAAADGEIVGVSETEAEPVTETEEEPEEAEPTREPEPTEDAEEGAEPTREPTAEPTREPTAEPTKEPTATPGKTPEPTAVPTETPTAAPSATFAPTATPTALSTATPTATPKTTPSATPKVTPSATPTATSGARTDTQSVLKTTSGEALYIKNAEGKFVEAKFADYFNSNIKEFYRKVSHTKGEYKYTGWQQLDGATFFFDKNGNKVTGEQVIQGAKYNFNSDGSLNTGSGHLGIDVSRYNGNIDWNAVKNSGVSYVIIRCGYRGSASGALVEDSAFRKNIQGAASAGLKVGVYFFTQAVNEVEAVEEASMVLSLIKGYNLTYPVFLDVEVTSGNNGRADHISVDTRTAVCNAFCQTIQNSGYKAGIYANKTWFTTHINTPALTGYKIWLAQYAAAPTYNRTKYDMWQYSSKGKVAGISGNVDMNISYMGY